MKINKRQKAMSEVIAVLCGFAYFVFIAQPLSGILWGFAIFFAGISLFSEESE